MPRPQKKYHYIYKTTCLVTGKFYVGMHSTDNLDDGYLGSGKILNYSRKKHGDQNHKKEIIEMCPSREALKLREREIVNEQLLADSLNMNLKYGGDGGGKLWNQQHSEKFHKAGYRAMMAIKDLSAASKKAWSNHREKMEVTCKATLIRVQPKAVIAAASERSNEKRKATFAAIGHQQGTKNSMSGKIWMTKDGISKPQPKHLMEELINCGWEKGRVLKIRSDGW